MTLQRPWNKFHLCYYHRNTDCVWIRHGMEWEVQCNQLKLMDDSLCPETIAIVIVRTDSKWCYQIPFQWRQKNFFFFQPLCIADNVFLEIFGQKKCLFLSKKSVSWTLHGIYCIFSNLRLRRKNDAFVVKIVNTRLTKIFMAIFAPHERLPRSATLYLLRMHD